LPDLAAAPGMFATATRFKIRGGRRLIVVPWGCPTSDNPFR
jgi:hypothetical protein